MSLPPFLDSQAFMTSSSLLILLLLFGLPRVRAEFSRVAWRTITPASSCIIEASARQPASMLELTNGSCLLFDACSTPQTEGLPPLYKLVPSDSMLILRTHAHGSVSPYELLKTGQSNASLVRPSQLTGTVFPFRSPLIDVQPTLLSRLHLVMSDGLEPDVNLTFAVDSDKSVTTVDAWFSGDNLQSSFPWRVERPREAKYYFSSFEKNEKVLRFYLKIKGRSCEFNEGFIVVVEKPECLFQATNYPAAYHWVPIDKKNPQLLLKK